MSFFKSYSYVAAALFVAACGGGGGGNTASPSPNPPAPPPTSEQPEHPDDSWLSLIEESPETKSEDRLKEIYAGAASARYQGFTELAEIIPKQH